MGLREWLIDKLGGDTPVERDPAAVVEVALVEMWRSELIAVALGEAGIEASVVPDQSAQWSGERSGAHARILVRDDQRTEAVEIVDRLTIDRYGPTDD